MLTRLSLRLAVLLSLAAVSVTAAPTPSAVPGEEPIASYDWEHHLPSAASGDAAHLQLIDPPPGMTGKVLKITNPAKEPLRLEVLTINAPAVTRDFYALRGQVRYENVTGDGYLEMWNTFPGHRNYFSRTLGQIPSDPMAKLSGTSDWRPVLLPFNAAGSGAHPEKLTINIVLPGPGTVYLSAFQFLQYDPKSIGGGGGKTGWAAPANLFNALVAMSTLLAGAMAFFMWRARHQRNRTLVLAGAWSLTALGAVGLMVGLLGWMAGWSTALSLMLFIGGLVIAGAFALGALSFQRAYRSAEWRRMTALDA